MPEHIFIYRDGVGDSMRQMVIDEELNQLHKIVAEELRDNTPTPPQIKSTNKGIVKINCLTITHKAIIYNNLETTAT